MANPFRPLGSAFRDLFDEFFMLILASMLWSLMSLPLLFFAYMALSAGAFIIAIPILLLSALPFGPATSGLSYMTFRISDGRAVKISDFFQGMRSHAGPGWVIGASFMAGLSAIFFNLGFYGNTQGFFAGLMLGLWLYLLLFWCSMLVYSFPLVFLQEQPELRLLIRNAALMVFGKPVFTLLTLLFMAIVLAVSLILVIPFVLITPAFLNLWSMRAARYLIRLDELRREAAAGTTAAAPPEEERGRKGQVRPK